MKQIGLFDESNRL